MNFLWSMINTQQIILMLPLFYLSIPANCSIFFGFLMKIAAFDIIPTDYLYEDLLGFEKPDAINENLDAEGFESTLFLFNVGSMIIAISSYPVLILVNGILKCMKSCCGNKSYIARKQAALSKSLFWGHPIVTIIESY